MNAISDDLIQRAATIDERLSDGFRSLPGGRDDTDLAARRVAAWCRASANGDWSQFGRRLQRDGLSLIDVMGQNGRVAYDYARADQVRLKRRGETDWETIPVPASNGFGEEIGHFLKAIQGQETLSCTGQDGLRAVEILQANYVC